MGRGGCREKRGRAFDLQACDGVSVWISGCVVGDGLDDSRRVHVYCEERFAEPGVLRVNGVHVIYCVDEGWDVDLVEIQAPDAVEVSFDAGEGVDAEFGRGLDIFPGYHGDILVKGPEIFQWLDQRHALFQWANVDEVGENISLEPISAGAFRL